ncbi:MAG TPA: gamma-glutamyl-gamma-aminobutyrate hydrolase family protein [Micromonosporaceae bacterium]|nr:gamma-glutamyl-gamma-aminobutyrate hydrolase family protein [Micromonosporaceae bacterium]
MTSRAFSHDLRVRPLIGLTTYGETMPFGSGETYAAALPMAYVRAVQASGGRAVLLPEDDPGADVLDALDGIVFTGGADVQPSYYGQTPHPRTYLRPARDDSEMMLLRAALDRDMPVLAICRGMQLLTVAYGGRLHQHLPDVLGHDRHRPSVGYGTHDVRLAAGSACAAMLGERTTVNSLHHQGVADVGSLTATGWAVDVAADQTAAADLAPAEALVEAVEDPSKSFVVGVQWHPEQMTDWRLFEGFLRVVAGDTTTALDGRPATSNARDRTDVRAITPG